MNFELRQNCLRLLRAFCAVLLAGTVVFSSAFLVLWEVKHNGNVVENGHVEVSQLILLFSATIAYAARARSVRGGRGPAIAFTLCSLFILAMGVRELDGIFDMITGNRSSWAYVDTLVILSAALVLFRSFGRSAHDLAEFATGPEAPLLIGGVLLTVLFAQAIGYKGIWNTLFDVPIWQEFVAPLRLPDGSMPGDIDIARHIKNTAEEGLELGGYLLIFLSAVLPPALARRR